MSEAGPHTPTGAVPQAPTGAVPEPEPSVIIVAMSVDAPARDRELRDLAEATGACIAYLQAGDPSLCDELSQQYALGTTSFRLTGLSVATRAPARSWIRRVAGHWLRDHPDATIQISGKLVTGNEAPLQSSAWEHVPAFRHHVFVCRGPRCSARGSAETTAALSKAMADRGFDDNDALMTQTGCLFPCNHSPVVAVHPDDVWYGHVDHTEAERIVDEHLIGGVPVEPLRLPKGSQKENP